MKRIQEGASGAESKAPAAPGYKIGKKGPREARKNFSKKQREATAGNGRQQRRSRKRRHRNQQEAKATGGNGRQQRRSRKLGNKHQQEAKATGGSGRQQRRAEIKATNTNSQSKARTSLGLRPLFGEKTKKKNLIFLCGKS